MKKFLLLMLALITMGGLRAEKMDLTFSTAEYCAAKWNAETKTLTWGSGGWNDAWTFMAVNSLSGDLSSWTKMVFKLEDFNNSKEAKLTLYFKENKGNTQSMDYVAKAELVPDENGIAEIDLTTFDWKNDKTPTETIDKTNIADVTIYGGERTDATQDGSVKVTETYLLKEEKASSISFTIDNSNGDNLIALDQENQETDNPHADKVEEDGYTAYTATTGSLTVAIKVKNIDVTGCNYAIIKFAEPVPAGWAVSFWSGMNFEGLAEGATEYKFDFATGAHADAGVKDNVLPEITLMTNPFGGPTTPSTVKVEGIYVNQPTDGPSTRTFCSESALDFSEVEGVEAYVLTELNVEKATLKAQKVTKVPANTGLYLVGEAGKYTVPTIDDKDAEAIEANMLVGVTEESPVATAENGVVNLVLAKKGADRGFYPIEEEGFLAANKAYLQVSTPDFEALTQSEAPLRIEFTDDEATAITKVNTAKAADNTWYTLSGARLYAQPTAKGVYINNGKKVVIK